MSMATKAFTSRQRKQEDIVRNFLTEVGRTPLLSHEEEISLGKKVQTRQNLYKLRAELAGELGREPTLDEWAQAAGLNQETLEAVLRQGDHAHRKMVKANLRLVVNISRNYQRRGLELLDLIQEGAIGLEKGVEKFDPTKGFRFSTYGYWWIRQAITRAIAEKSRTIKLPSHLTEKLNKIKKAQRELAQPLGRVPTHAELSEAVNLSSEKIQQLLQFNQQPVSLDLSVGEKQDITLGELLEDPGMSPHEWAEQAEEIANLHSMMGEFLTQKQKQVLVLRFGLDGEEARSLAKVGKSMQISRERARQIEATALKRLRVKLLKEYQASKV